MTTETPYHSRIARILGLVGGKPDIRRRAISYRRVCNTSSPWTKFLLDQNSERHLAPFLMQVGPDVKIISVDYPAGWEDDDILAIASQEHRFLLTNDRSDFGELTFRRHVPHRGVILFRHIRSGDLCTKQQRLSYMLEEYADQLYHFLVATPERVTVRKALKHRVA